MKNLKNCRCCGGDELEKVIDFSMQPLATFYHRGQTVPHFPLEINLCHQCFHRQLSVVVDPTLMFDNYLDVSGNDTAFIRHCTNFSSDVMKWWFKNRKKTNRISVIDIGCNDGTLLEEFQKNRCLIQGVDSAKNLREITKEEKRIRVKVGYWGDNIICQKLGRFDIVTATRLFDKIDNLGSFLDDCLTSLVDDGCIVFEVPYVDLGLETINHEKLSYFLVSSAKTIIENKGLNIVRLSESGFEGRSLRFFLTKEGEHCPAVERLINQEKESGVRDPETYKQWEIQSKEKAIAIKETIEKLKNEGNRVVGFGTSHKVNGVLSFCQLELEYTVGENALDYMCSKSNVLIKPINTLEEEKESLCIFLPDQANRAISKSTIENMTIQHHCIEV